MSQGSLGGGSQESHQANPRKLYKGYDSDLFLGCLSTIPTDSVLQYRIPGTMAQDRHCPLALEVVVLPQAVIRLAVHAGDDSMHLHSRLVHNCCIEIGMCCMRCGRW